MIFIPIGHDQTIRRFPWLTVAIMAICTLLQIHRAVFAPTDREIETAIYDRDARQSAVLDRLKIPDVPDGDDDEAPPAVAPIVVPPELANAEPAKLLAAVREGKLGDPADPAIVALRASDATLAAVRGRDLAQRFGYRPSSRVSINLVLSAFVHGGFLHLAGNLLFLWLCGCNLEDRWGRLAFSGFYLLSAIAAGVVFAAFHPGSETPLVGASGAIAGAMGGFLVCYHSAQIKYWYYWRFRSGVTYLPAYVAFPVWFLAQVGQSFLEVSGLDEVAYSAHIGGFAFGVVGALIVRFSGLERFLMPPNEDEESDYVPPPMEQPVVARAPSIPPRPRSAPPPRLSTPPPPNEWIAELERSLEADQARDDLRYELCKAAIDARDMERIDATATRTFVWLGEQSRWSDILELQRAMEGSGFERNLSDRAYSMIVRAAVECRDPKLCVRVATRFSTTHPESPLMPRALWDVATAQAGAGRDDLSRKTLNQLVERWPEHRFADEARKRLRSA